MKRKLLFAAVLAAGAVGFKAQAAVNPTADGIYYLYNVDAKQFMGRGGEYGTRAAIDDYGVPFKLVDADNDAYQIQFLDADTKLGFDGYCYTDAAGGNIRSFKLIVVDDDAKTYKIQNTNNSKFVEDWYGFTVADADENRHNYIWQFLSKAEHDAIVSAYPTNNINAVIESAELETDAASFASYLATNYAAKDMTSKIGTAKFTGSIGSWTWSEVRARGGQPAYGTNFCEIFEATGTFSQEITGLAQGLYKVTVNGFERAAGYSKCNTLGTEGYEIVTSYLEANGQKVQLKSWYSEKTGESNPNNTSEAVAAFNANKYQNEVYAYVEADGKMTIKLAKPAHVGGSWVLFNNFTLTYYSDAVSEEEATAIITTAEALTDDPMLGTTASTLASTLSDFKSSKTIANYNALSSAIDNATTSVAAYAMAKTAIDKANAIKKANNFVSSSATTTFEEAIAAISDAYDARTLADATAANAETTLGTNVSAWHGNPTGAAGVYMESVWDNADNFADYYINTWSNEGDNDGSGFSVPFFEYWVGSGSLAAKTMTGTLVGLTANQLYKITADVRVAYSTKVDGSITLAAGEGTPVDVTSGTQIGSTGRYLGTFSAYGKANSDGELTAVIEVAENSGISWLSWKNITYEETNLDFSALNTAISNANTVNAKIAGGVNVLTTAISTAEDVISSATTQDEVNDAVTALTSATEDAETTIAARLKLAGTVKKATALKSYLDEDITSEITSASSYAADADATAAEATSKTNALNAYFSGWEEVSLTNANFDTNIVVASNGTNSGTKVTGTSNNYELNGWTFVKQGSKWDATHSASAVYGASAGNGTNSSNAPATDMYGEKAGGVMHISAGWEQYTRYEQAIASLPAGKYVIYYEAFNANSGATTISDNYFGINNFTTGDLDGTNNTFIFNADKTYTYNSWTTHVAAFNLVNNVTSAKLNIGVKANGSGSGNTAKLWIDNVKIYRYAESANMTITNAKWATFCAPFDVAIPENVTAYKVTGTEEDGTTLTLENEDVTTTIPANTPVVLYKDVDATFSTTVYGKAVDGTPTEGLLTGTYANGTAVPAGSYVLLNQDDVVAFYHVANEGDATVDANRAYLTVPAQQGDAKPRAFYFNTDATAIQAISALTSGDYEGIYTVGGAKLNGLQKGINIVKLKNGETRKVLVK